MKISKLIALSLSVFLTACGGGGGDPGAGSGNGGGTGVVNWYDTVLSVVLKNPNDTSSESIAAGGGSILEATLTTNTGKPVAGQVITIYNSILNDLAVYPNGVTATTDKDGRASVKISRAALDRYGSVSVYAKYEGTECYYYQSLCNANVVQYRPSSSESLGVRADPPALRMELRDASNQPTTSIAATGFTTVLASLKFADGTPVVNKRIDVSGDPARVVFPEGASQLTDTQGVASIKVNLAALNVNGAGTLTGASTLAGTTASGMIEETVVSALLDYQVGGANISLTGLDLGTGDLAAFGNRPISVKANVNGVLATNVPVQVTFNASCGVVNPAVVSTDGTGAANTTYTASVANCAGTNVTLSAAAMGATSLSGMLTVSPSVATNVQFISATPQLIYLRESVGTTQAQVVFKVVDSSGNPLQNKKLRLSLSNSSTGVSLDKVGSVSSVDLTSDSQGLVSAAVYSGTVPTSLNVRATLLDANDQPTNVFSNSNLLTVATGRPVQRSLSLAFDKLSIEGFNLDGDEAYATLSLADRQGNPVPPGTQVNFVTEAGVMMPAVCFVPPVTPATVNSPAIPTSYCTVKIRSQGTRSVNGRVSVLAYVEGEEDFVDVNGNNVYDMATDTFTDLGRAFRDDNGAAVSGTNGTYDTGEFQVPRASVAACVAGIGCVGDGVWGAADVRKQGTIIFATSTAVITPGAVTTAVVPFVVADGNGNSMPTGSEITVTAVDQTSNDLSCSVAAGSTAVIPNALGPFPWAVSLKDCATGDSVIIEVKTPKTNTITSRTIRLP
jgi:hypothetical protein